MQSAVSPVLSRLATRGATSRPNWVAPNRMDLWAVLPGQLDQEIGVGAGAVVVENRVLHQDDLVRPVGDGLAGQVAHVPGRSGSRRSRSQTWPSSSWASSRALAMSWRVTLFWK